MANLDAHVDKLEAQLRLWGAKLNEVMARANLAGAQAKLDSQRQLDELKDKLAAARVKLDEAKEAGGEKWEAVKDGLEHAWAEIEGAFKKVVH